MSRVPLIAAAAALALLTACASRALRPQPTLAPDAEPASPAVNAPNPLPHYRCDHDISFTVLFEDDTAVIDAGSRGRETLERDAGGLTPQQTAYSSTAMRAEFGLDPDGRGAKVRWVDPPLEASCIRD